MGDMTISVDNAALLKAMDDIAGPVMLAFTLPAAEISADNVVHEAQSRVARATGETANGIHKEESRNGEGYVVLDFNTRMPNLPLWLEMGTDRGRPRSHSMPSRPFFFSSAELEQGPHQRRMTEAVQAAIDSVGLGD